MSVPTSLWTRTSNQIDIHYDFEFLDRQLDGLSIISFGAVFKSNDKLVNYYGVNRSFFASPEFVQLVRVWNTDDNAKWLAEHVFKHFILRLDGRPSLPMYIKHNRSFVPTEGFANHISAKLGVVAGLKGKAGNEVQSRCGTTQEIAADILRITEEFGIENPDVRLFGYHTATDHLLLCNMFGGVIKMPKNFSKVSFDLRQMSDAYCLNHDEFDPKTPHQSLLDARVQYNLYVKMKKHLLAMDPEMLGRQVVGA